VGKEASEIIHELTRADVVDIDHTHDRSPVVDE